MSKGVKKSKFLPVPSGDAQADGGPKLD